MILFCSTLILSADKVDVEDGGQALIAEINDNMTTEDEDGVFVRIQSWDENKNHTLFRSAMGKKVTVVVLVGE
jgi:hypothetical protein